TVDRGEAMAARTERMRAVEGFLRRRLAAAQPIAFGQNPDTGGALRFIGEPDRIRFVADLPSYLGRGGPHLHDIAVFGSDAGEALAVSFDMVLAGETVEEDDPRPPEPLVDGLTELRIRYRGLDEQGLTDWLDAWESYEQLPLQVSIEIASKDGGTWPALVVALPQAASAPEFGSGRASRLGPRVGRGVAPGGRSGTNGGARNRLRDARGRR